MVNLVLNRSVKMNEVQIFDFGGFRKVRVFVRDGEPWFVAKDACDILGLVNVTKALTNLDDDEVSNLTTTEVRNLEIPNRGVNIVNEPGLYTLIFQSRRPEAKAFKRWITHVVLPSVRKTGRYIVPKKEHTKAEIEEAGRSFFMDCYRKGGVELYLEKRYSDSMADPRNRGGRKLTRQEKYWFEEAESAEFLVKEGRL
jgi:prophage antirepressor-like protein